MAEFVEDRMGLEDRKREELAKINESLKKMRLDIFPIPIPFMYFILYIYHIMLRNYNGEERLSQVPKIWNLFYSCLLTGFEISMRSEKKMPAIESSYL